MTHEDHEQAALFEWASYHKELKWMHSIPNGGQRHIATAAKLKKTGVKAGVLDIFLPVWRPPYNGLYIEMKVGKNKLTPAQAEFSDFVTMNNFKVAVCYSASEAIGEIMKYMDWHG